MSLFDVKKLRSFKECHRADYRVVSAVELKDDEVETLIQLSKEESKSVSTVLGGRATLIRGKTDGLGEIVLKNYRRGGFLRKIIPSFSLAFPRPSILDSKRSTFRSLREMQALLALSPLGLRVPKPLAIIIQGKIFCREWLVMERLPAHESLAEMSLTNQSRLEQYIPEVIRQIEILVDQRILHVDLHPGNVLVVEGKGVYLIDFDHADTVSLSKAEIRDRYIRRWRRAVIKHQLPDELSELLCAGLRKKFNESPISDTSNNETVDVSL